MKTIVYFWQGKQFQTTVPDNWPENAVAEVCGFRAGANPGDVFELVMVEGRLELIATGTS